MVAHVTPMQAIYLTRLAAEPAGPVSAYDMFNRLRMSKLSVARMVSSGVIERHLIGGLSHYRLTAAGRDVIQSQGVAA